MTETAQPIRADEFQAAASPGRVRLLCDVVGMLPANLAFWTGRPWRNVPEARPESFGAFLGINVTAGADGQTDDYVLERILELGIRQVRIDLGDAATARNALRLARSISEAGLRVVCHMVQSPELAARTSAAELAPWKAFCESVAGELGGAAEAMEAGSAPNRHRWSGHTAAGYVETARAVFEAARSAGIEAWAPNVSDFEPFYSVGLLAALASAGLVPDRHSVNLFVDRAGTPEAVDAHAFPFRADLHGKARLLAAAGRHFGCASTVSTFAYWTLDTAGRGRRRYVDEDAYARLAVRYLAIAACCGWLDRAYWGQMVGHAKGLIDDGTTLRPRPPVAHHSFVLHGEVGNYRARPGFEAIRRMTARLGPLRPGGLVREDGVWRCEFTSDDEMWTVAWSPDGERKTPAALLEGAEAVEDIFGRATPRDDAAGLRPSPLFFRTNASARSGAASGPGE